MWCIFESMLAWLVGFGVLGVDWFYPPARLVFS